MKKQNPKNRKLKMNLGLARLLVCLSIITAIAPNAIAAPSFGSAGYSGQRYPTTDASNAPTRTSETSIFNRPNISPFSPSSHNVAVNVGQVFLTGELANTYEDSIGTQIGYTYGVSDLFAFDAGFGYSSHSNSELTLAHLLTGLRTNLVFYDKLIPFASFGLGFYRPSISNATTSYSSILFGLNLGAGVDLALSNNVFFGSKLAYHDMFDSSKIGSDGKLHNVGGAFISFMIHAGMTF